MSKGKNIGNRVRVARMWVNDPRCHWCKVVTTRVTGGQIRLEPHAATYDHLYHKSDPMRSTRKGRHVGVLACYECNQKRGRDEHIKTLPAWNRFLIKYNLPIPVYKIRKKVYLFKRKFGFITKNLNWAKRHAKYRYHQVMGHNKGTK